MATWYSARVAIEIVGHHSEGETRSFWTHDESNHNLSYDDVVLMQAAGVDFMKKMNEAAKQNAQAKKGQAQG